jgi:hypothetical protein
MDDDCPLSLRAMAISLRRWLPPGPNVEAALADHQDVDMEDVNEVAAALPAKKGKRKASVVAEQPDPDLQPSPAKQAHVVVTPLKFLLNFMKF